MSRTHRNLWPQLVSWDNLLTAYRKCRRRKRYRQAATQFDFCWEQNLLQLQRELLDGSWQHGEYYHFHITDPKPRKISAAPFRDRIVHHAVVAVLEPIFERSFIFDSYACRRGKGTHRAIRRAQHFQRCFPWCLKTDVVRFFPNIDHEILLAILRRKIADPRVLWLIEIIIRSGAGILDDEASQTWFPGDDLFAVLRPKGLPIGNLTSQFFANVYLDPIDHFVREELRIGGYIRYADDLALFGSSRSETWDAAAALSVKLEELRLRMHSRKTHVAPTDQPMTFLGYRVSPHELRLSQQAIRRFNRRARQQKYDFAAGRTNCSEIAGSLKAWLAHARHANSKAIQKTLLRGLILRRPRAAPPP